MITTPTFSTELFQQVPVVGILRGFDPDLMCGLVGAVRRGGLTNLEVTMNSPAASEQIAIAVREAGGSLNVGAGTVTSLPLLEQALAAGAQFIVTPTVTEPVIGECVRRGIPVFPGAFSPTEIYRAWELGATMVKLFPAEKLGPSFVRGIKGPLPQIKLMPTGGVDLKTLEAYWKAGAEGFGIGGPLFDPARVGNRDWSWVEQRAKAFVEAFQQAAKSGV